MHKHCLQQARIAALEVDEGVHAEWAYRCRHCRCPYRIIPNAISVFGAVPSLSPLARIVHRLLLNPMAPTIASMVLMLIAGYMVKLTISTIQLDWSNTEWTFIDIYHWVLGGFFLISLTICEKALSDFFDVFSLRTQRVIMFLFSLVVPILFAWVAKFCLWTFTNFAWSWDIPYGYGIVLEAIFLPWIVPSLARVGVEYADSFEAHTPAWLQRIIDRIMLRHLTRVQADIDRREAVDAAEMAAVRAEEAAVAEMAATAAQRESSLTPRALGTSPPAAPSSVVAVAGGAADDVPVPNTSSAHLPPPLAV
jgi:hypothetical protein